MFVVILILSSFQFLIGILPLSWMLPRGARWTVLWNSYLRLQPALGDRQWQGSVPVVLPARPALPWETCWWFHACLLCRAVSSMLKRVPAVLGVTMRVSRVGTEWICSPRWLRGWVLAVPAQVAGGLARAVLSRRRHGAFCRGIAGTSPARNGGAGSWFPWGYLVVF